MNFTRKILYLILVTCLFSTIKCIASNSYEAPANIKSRMKKGIILVSTDFSNKMVSPWSVHANKGDIVVVPNPVYLTKHALKAHINVNEDFSSVVNGAPRAEILDAGVKFENEKEYLIIFNTYLPKDFQTETVYSNPHSFFQILQPISDKYSQFVLEIEKSNYIMVVNFTDALYPTLRCVRKDLGSIKGDLGKWINWEVYFKPSNIGNGRAIIWKNGLVVQDYNGLCAYDGYVGYLKMGIYKWNWKKDFTTTSDLTTYFSDIKIYQAK